MIGVILIIIIIIIIIREALDRLRVRLNMYLVFIMKLTDSAAEQTADHSSRGIIRVINSALKLTCSNFTSAACTSMHGTVHC